MSVEAYFAYSVGSGGGFSGDGAVAFAGAFGGGDAFLRLAAGAGGSVVLSPSTADRSKQFNLSIWALEETGNPLVNAEVNQTGTWCLVRLCVRAGTDVLLSFWDLRRSSGIGDEARQPCSHAAINKACRLPLPPSFHCCMIENYLYHTYGRAQ